MALGLAALSIVILVQHFSIHRLEARVTELEAGRLRVLPRD